MSVLSGRQIRGLVQNGKLKVENFDVSLIQAATLDLRVGMKVLASPTSPEKHGKVIEPNMYILISEIILIFGIFLYSMGWLIKRLREVSNGN